MKHLLQILTFLVGLLSITTHAVAAQDVGNMSDIQVSEYAIRMSEVMEEIQQRQLCAEKDTSCVRAEFARHGVSYDDKESVQKRLALMVGSFY